MGFHRAGSQRDLCGCGGGMGLRGVGMGLGAGMGFQGAGSQRDLCGCGGAMGRRTLGFRIGGSIHSREPLALEFKLSTIKSINVDLFNFEYTLIPKVLARDFNLFKFSLSIL